MFALVNQPVVHANRRNKQTARVQASEGSEGYGSSSDTPRFSLRMTPPLPRTADRCDYQGDPGLCGCAAVARALPVYPHETLVLLWLYSVCQLAWIHMKNTHKQRTNTNVKLIRLSNAPKMYVLQHSLVIHCTSTVLSAT